MDMASENGLKYLKNIKLLGDLSKLEHVLRSNIIDLVIVTLPLRSCYNEIDKILSLCETTGVEVEIPLELFNPKISKISLSKFEDIDFLNFYTGAYQMHWRHIIKRSLDITISLVLSVLLMPVFFFTIILIKRDSPGSAMFKQKRVGLNGRLFSLYKFRTMVQNAELLKSQLEEQNELDGPVFKIKKDPRITKIGNILRRTSIDELPQLINVIKGDMSLVGPRPPLPDEVNKYKLSDRRRLSVRPGITGLWQVSGRNDIPFEKWMELDREYIDKWSLFLDMKILVKTVSVVFSMKNAF
jgi:exopolysaccharide biosynthesis polyprenyl glycosylphosphotransferase